MTAGKSKHRSGFTLIELLVTIAVAVILATIAVPNFQNLLARNKLASDYNSILSAVNYTRSEAVKKRGNVTLSVSSTGGVWDLEVTYNDGANDVVLRKLEPVGSGVVISNSTLAFNALGRLAACDTDAVSNCQITLGDMSITVNPAGSVNPDV
jgi:type IV fimbrial biogenesis protein FimT